MSEETAHTENQSARESPRAEARRAIHFGPEVRRRSRTASTAEVLLNSISIHLRHAESIYTNFC